MTPFALPTRILIIYNVPYAPFRCISVFHFQRLSISYKIPVQSFPSKRLYTDRSFVMAKKKGGRQHERPKPDNKEGGAKPKKPPLTHFLSLPIVNESSRSQLQDSLSRFADDITGAGSIFHEKALRPLGALHFTIGVMSLMEKERLDGAVQILRNLDIHEMLSNAEIETSQDSAPNTLLEIAKADSSGTAEQIEHTNEPSKLQNAEILETVSDRHTASEISSSDQEVSSTAEKKKWTVEPFSSEPLSSLMRPVSPPSWPRPASETTTVPSRRSCDPESPLNLKITALCPMQSPHKTSILYASVEDASSRLLPFASNLKKSFTEAGFLVLDARPLKLHATIVNTIYAKQGHPRARRRRAKNSTETSTQEPHNRELHEAQVAKLESEDEHHQAQPEDEHRQPESEDEHHDRSGTAGEDEKSEGEDEDRGEVGGGASNADDREEPQKPKFPMRFDARSLIEKYKDFVWASDVHLDRLAICEMGAKKVYDANGKLLEGKYTEIASIPLP